MFMEISFPAYDMHVHFRQGDTLYRVVPETARHFAGALIMPNPKPPICTAADVVAYKDEIMHAAGPYSGFEPMMTFKIKEDTTPEMVREFRPSLTHIPIAIAGKVYPKGLTTNAEDGVEDFFALFPVFEALQEISLTVCLHGEKPGNTIEGFEREREFLRTLFFIARTFPNLKIVLEHISTADAVDAILHLPDNVRATITVHHLMLTYDDVGCDRMRPHNYCKPVAKTSKDRAALIEAATSGCPKFMFGSDSAPHEKDAKETDECCAGVYTAPIALPLLAQIFESRGALDRLPNFAGGFARPFYEIYEPMGGAKVVTLIKEPMIVPDTVGGFVPFWAGQELAWSIKNTES